MDSRLLPGLSRTARIFDGLKYSTGDCFLGIAFRICLLRLPRNFRTLGLNLDLIGFDFQDSTAQTTIQRNGLARGQPRRLLSINVPRKLVQ